MELKHQNRKKLPNNITIPRLPHLKHSEISVTAHKEILDQFSSNIGSSGLLRYPTTFTEAERWLEPFLTERFFGYGPYQDSIHPSHIFLFIQFSRHSSIQVYLLQS